MSTKVVDIADEIFQELSNDSTISLPVISYWLHRNIGTLNNLIFTNFAVNETTGEFSPSNLDNQQKSILKKLYQIHFYNTKVTETLGAASVDSVLSVTSDGASVTKLNKNSLSQTYLMLKKNHQEELTALITAYKMGQSAPLQVSGDDYIASNETAEAADADSSNRNL